MVKSLYYIFARPFSLVEERGNVVKSVSQSARGAGFENIFV